MKKILILILLLNGCAVYDNYFKTGYDNQEYEHIAEIRLLARQGALECGNPYKAANITSDLLNKAELFEIYEEHRPKNDSEYDAAIKLREIVEGLNKRYQEASVRYFYCKTKFESIDSSAGVIQEVIGNRPR
jgi:hypothetical protein